MKAWGVGGGEGDGGGGTGGGWGGCSCHCLRSDTLAMKVPREGARSVSWGRAFQSFTVRGIKENCLYTASSSTHNVISSCAQRLPRTIVAHNLRGPTFCGVL